MATNTSTKIFAGCLVTSEIRMHLNQSIQWKNDSLLAKASPAPATSAIIEVHHNGKDFFGIHTPNKELIIKDLIAIQSNIRKQLKSYCPSLETENAKICVFPQVFIA